jgi:heme/copper-type cytochrome/quinol oxidase subunit 3
MNFNPMNFINNLYYMLFGMLGIFVVIGIIILFTIILNNLSTKKSHN